MDTKIEGLALAKDRVVMKCTCCKKSYFMVCSAKKSSIMLYGYCGPLTHMGVDQEGFAQSIEHGSVVFLFPPPPPPNTNCLSQW